MTMRESLPVHDLPTHDRPSEPGHGSFAHVFGRALRGHTCTALGPSERAEEVPVHTWRQDADATDLALLGYCVGRSLDVGCGPGRLTAALADLGHAVLGIDLVPEAVRQTRDRGVPALRCNAFDRVPGEGQWHSVLLADGNVGIGGDPVALLQRTGELLGTDGRVVVELAGPGVPATTRWLALECDSLRSRSFPWSVVGTDDIEAVARASGFGSAEVHRLSDVRWCAVLRPGPHGSAVPVARRLQRHGVTDP